jgi:hypothetical protein
MIAFAVVMERQVAPRRRQNRIATGGSRTEEPSEPHSVCGVDARAHLARPSRASRGSEGGSELAVDQAHHFDTPVIEAHRRLTIQHLGQRLLTGRLRAQCHSRDVLSQLVVGQDPDIKAGR